MHNTFIHIVTVEIVKRQSVTSAGSGSVSELRLEENVSLMHIVLLNLEITHLKSQKTI